MTVVSQTQEVVVLWSVTQTIKPNIPNNVTTATIIIYAFIQSNTVHH
jgi:hypothetical protein